MRSYSPPDEHDDAFINYVGDLIDRVHRLETALTYIKENLGRVCAEFTECSHDACRSSCASWFVADEALATPGPGLVPGTPSPRDGGLRGTSDLVHAAGVLG